MIEYSVGILLKKLLKEWHIIIITAVLFGIFSVPLANKSYYLSLDEYKRYTENIEMKKKDINNKMTFCMLTVRTNSNDEVNDTQMIYSLLNNEEIIKIINSKIFIEDKVELENWNEKINISILDKSNIIFITSTEINKIKLEKLIGKIIEVIKNEVLDYMDTSIEMYVQNIQEIEMDSDESELQSDFFAEQIMEQPSKIQNYSKIIITSVLFGSIIGVLISLIKIYIQENVEKGNLK